MSEIPTQSSLRGDHESSEPEYYGDYEYPAADETDTAALDPSAVDTAVVPADTVDLDSDPFADDLNKELAAAAPKRWANRATIVIAALFLLVGGFLGGAQVEKHYGQQSTNTSAASLLAALRNRAGGGAGFGTGRGTGAGGGFGTPTGTASAPANTTTGTVKFVDGTTLYVTEADGTVIIVNTSASTKVTITSVSTLAKLKVGQKVSVVGPTDSSGSVTASTVTGTP